MNKTEYYTDEIAVAKIRILNALHTAASMELKLIKIEFSPSLLKKNDFERHEECICIHKTPTHIMRKGNQGLMVLKKFSIGDVFGIKVNLNLYNLPPSASFQNSQYKVAYQFRIILKMWDRFYPSSSSVKLWSPRPQ